MSVGSAEHPMGLKYDRLPHAGNIKAARLKKLVVGDAGGIFDRARRRAGRSSS